MTRLISKYDKIDALREMSPKGPSELWQSTARMPSSLFFVAQDSLLPWPGPSKSL